MLFKKFSLFKSVKSSIPIEVGDRFEKLDIRSSFWTVEALVINPNFPLHARIIDEISGRVATISVSVLNTEKYRLIAKQSSKDLDKELNII